MKKQKWYKEKTFKLTIITMSIIGIVFCIGSSWADGQFNPGALYLFGSVMILTTTLSYFLRNNP